jgi:protocatechuate 3,4-dioxygenase alpha subunit
MRADARRTQLVAPDTVGERIRLEGNVYDGDGVGVPDELIEVGQANHEGRYNHPADARDRPLDPAFHGFGRAATDAAGSYFFETIKPGRVPFNDQRLQAAHICVAVFARGLLNHAFTRLYFADDPANADDPVLQIVPAERRATLLARRGDEAGITVYQFDIRLQGAGETVFFNLSGK